MVTAFRTGSFAALLVVATVSLAGAQAAHAQLSMAQSSMAQSSMPALWTGFYVGGTVGYGETDNVATFEPSGAVYGFYGGYNHAFGPWVAGIEVDYSWADISDSARIGADRVTLEVDNLGSVRGRLGYAFDKALIYATAGYAWGDAGTNGVVGGVRFSRETDFDGFVVGGGLEYKFAPNVSGRIEGLHYSLGPDSNGQDVDDLDATVVRGGLTFHFNGN